MTDEPTLWQRLSDALPWNWKRAQRREALAHDLLDQVQGDLPQAASAAEAIAAIKHAKPRPSGEKKASSSGAHAATAGGTALRERWRSSERGKAGNERLRAFGRDKGAG